jgi:hypothetical protein
VFVVGEEGKFNGISFQKKNQGGRHPPLPDIFITY